MILTTCHVSRALKSAVSVLAFALTALAASSTDVLAQAPAPVATPDKGVIAWGGDIGVLFPDEEFENALTFDAFGEYYVHPRIAVRGIFAWANPGRTNRTEDHYRQVKLLFGATYNWRYKAIRPFPGAARECISSDSNSKTNSTRTAKRAAASSSAAEPTSCSPRRTQSRSSFGGT
jgi:hypothetical protein